MTVKSINNRQRQKELETYKTRNEISEATFYVKKADFSPASQKYINYFLKTRGVTQANVATICKDIGISTSTYSETVKPEIENLLGESIIEIEKTQKLDRLGRKKVKGSTYKILIPLKKIIYLVKKYLKEKYAQKIAELQAFRADLFSVPGDDIESDIKSDIESDAEKLRQVSAEDDFSNEQNKSFRENLLEKSFNKLNITNLFIVKNFGKIKIKSEVKNYLNTFPLFRDFMSWTESKRYEIAKTIQLAIIKTKTDIEEPKPQIMIKRAIDRFMKKHADKPKTDFFRLLYTFVFNELKNDQEDDSESSEDHSEDDEEYFSPLFKKIIEKKARQERSPRQESVSRQELDDLGVF